MQESNTPAPQVAQPVDIQKLKAQVITGRTLWIVAAVIILAYLLFVLWILVSEPNDFGLVVLFFFTMPVPFAAGAMLVIGIVLSLSASKKIAATRHLVDAS